MSDQAYLQPLCIEHIIQTSWQNTIVFIIRTIFQISCVRWFQWGLVTSWYLSCGQRWYFCSFIDPWFIISNYNLRKLLLYFFFVQFMVFVPFSLCLSFYMYWASLTTRDTVSLVEKRPMADGSEPRVVPCPEFVEPASWCFPLRYPFPPGLRGRTHCLSHGPDRL